MLLIRVLFQIDLRQNRVLELLFVHLFADAPFPLNADQSLVPYVQDEQNLHLPNLHESVLVAMTFRHLCDVRQCGP